MEGVRCFTTTRWLMDTKRKNRKSELLFLYGALFVAFLAMLCYKRITGPSWLEHPSTPPIVKPLDQKVFAWSNAKPYFSGHARWRMECRHITETEVMEIVGQGYINFKKSDLIAPECKKRYALEGYSHEHQHIRVIATPCGIDKVTIVTCIDLDHRWPCDSSHDSKKHPWPYVDY